MAFPLSTAALALTVFISHFHLSVLCANSSLESPPCSVAFKGETHTFDACDTSQPIHLYYSLTNASNSLTTLFRAPLSSGYVSMAWGYSSLSSSGSGVHAIVASSVGTIHHYVMLSNSYSIFVPHPASTSPFTALDVDVDGGYIVGRFTRPLAADYDLGIPALASGVPASYTWEHGDLGSAHNDFIRHSSKRGAATVVMPNKPDVPQTQFLTSPLARFVSRLNIKSSAACTGSFKGITESFAACAISQLGAMNLYFSVSEDGQVDTLFQIPYNGTVAQYVAFGWGYSKMLGSLAVSAHVNPSSEAGVHVYNLTSMSRSGVVKVTAPSDFTALQVDISNNMLSGRYTSSLSNKSGSVPFIWALGGTSDHDSSMFSFHHKSRGTGIVDLSDLSIAPRTSTGTPYPRKRLHSICMAIAWTVLSPWAAIFMRFFKTHNPKALNVHRTANTMSAVLTLLGLLLVVLTSELNRNPHQIIGYVVVGLTALQLLGGFTRPAKDVPIRWRWYAMHSFCGSIAIILGFVNVYTGIHLVHFFGLTTYYTLTSIALVTFVLTYIALSAMPQRFPMVETTPFIIDDDEDDQETGEPSSQADRL